MVSKFFHFFPFPGWGVGVGVGGMDAVCHDYTFILECSY